MRIVRHTSTSAVFELVKTVELDIQLSEESLWTIRIEIFRNSENINQYRCRIWELDVMLPVNQAARLRIICSFSN
jgi:hypothetical protein